VHWSTKSIKVYRCRQATDGTMEMMEPLVATGEPRNNRVFREIKENRRPKVNKGDKRR